MYEDEHYAMSNQWFHGEMQLIDMTTVEVGITIPIIPGVDVCMSRTYGSVRGMRRSPTLLVIDTETLKTALIKYPVTWLSQTSDIYRFKLPPFSGSLFNYPDPYR